MPAPALEVQKLTYREAITSYVEAMCHQYRVKRANVKDLVQEALTQIIASVASYQPEKGDLDKWGRGVARNVVRRHLRDSKRYASYFSEVHSNMDEHAANEPSPERCMQRIEARCRLSTAADELTEQQAEVLMLFVVDEMSHKEIGTELEISEGASQKCYQRARNHLAHCIAGETLSVMPPFVATCNDPSGPNEVALQRFDWSKWPHYTGQVLATIIAFLCFMPSNPPAQVRTAVVGEIKMDHVLAMYRQDKQVVSPEKPNVYPGAPQGKPEAASLPSVRELPARKKIEGKPAPLRPFVSGHSYKHEVSSAVNLPSG
jgi:RNA polymerase sigma factor (sigma-70 family)